MDSETALFVLKISGSNQLWRTDGNLQNTRLVLDTGIPESQDYVQWRPMDDERFAFIFGSNNSRRLGIFNWLTPSIEQVAYLPQINSQSRLQIAAGSAYFLASSAVFGREPHYVGCFQDGGREESFRVYQDLNANQFFDLGEPGVVGLPVRVSSSSGASSLHFPDATGSYRFRFLQGEEYQLTPRLDECWMYSDSSQIADLTFTFDSSSYSVIQIGLLADATLTRTSSHLVSGPTRCGFDVRFWLTTTNEGCDFASITNRLVLPDSVVFVSADVPFQFGDTEQELIFDFPNQAAGSQSMVNLILTLPGEEFVGEEISFLSITSLSDLTTAIDSFHYTPIITCAIDPNDKQVLPARSEPGMNNYTQFDEELLYTVRFQNTGNDTAFTVRIEDQLSANLDWNSLRPVAASHSYTMKLDENGLLTVLFENILLPDSSANLVLSQGFVAFKLAMIEGLEDFTLLNNTAEIYFDFNAPIITNTVVTTAVEFLDFDEDGFFFWDDCNDEDELINPLAMEIPNNGIDEDCDDLDGPSSIINLSQQSISSFPNPTNGLLTLNLSGDWPNKVDYRLVNLASQLLESGRLNDAVSQINLSPYPIGTYFLSVYHSTEGRWYYLKVLRN